MISSICIYHTAFEECLSFKGEVWLQDSQRPPSGGLILGGYCGRALPAWPWSRMKRHSDSEQFCSVVTLGWAMACWSQGMSLFSCDCCAGCWRLTEVTALIQAPCWHCFASPCAQAEVGQAWGLQHSLLSLSLSLWGRRPPTGLPCRWGAQKEQPNRRASCWAWRGKWCCCWGCASTLAGPASVLWWWRSAASKQLWEWFP